MKFHLRKAVNRQWYVTIHAVNGRELFRTSETYHNRQDAVNAGVLVISNAASATFTEAAA